MNEEAKVLRCRCCANVVSPTDIGEFLKVGLWPAVKFVDDWKPYWDGKDKVADKEKEK